MRRHSTFVSPLESSCWNIMQIARTSVIQRKTYWHAWQTYSLRWLTVRYSANVPPCQQSCSFLLFLIFIIVLKFCYLKVINPSKLRFVFLADTNICCFFISGKVIFNQYVSVKRRVFWFRLGSLPLIWLDVCYHVTFSLQIGFISHILALLFSIRKCLVVYTSLLSENCLHIVSLYS